MNQIVLPIKGSESTYLVSPSKIVALGLNYRDHIAESQSVRVKGFEPEIPGEPILFPKGSNSLLPPDEPIVLPAFVDTYGFEDQRTDYEAELAFIVGKTCKNITVESAYDCIFGFLCLNDVSQRNIQTGDKSGWYRGKSFDTFCPVGPTIVRISDVGDPQDLAITCRLNGDVVQQSNTKHMIFPIREIVSYISKNFRLYEGDIITTGTPSGVGKLANGDVVEVEIENIGVLRNPVVAEQVAE